MANGIIVAYIRTKEQEHVNEYRVFIEVEGDRSVEEVAAGFYEHLEEMFEPEGWDIWSKNLCRIVLSTEPHYLNI